MAYQIQQEACCCMMYSELFWSWTDGKLCGS